MTHTSIRADSGRRESGPAPVYFWLWDQQHGLPGTYRLSGSWAPALTTYSDLWVGPALCVKKACWASPACSHLRSTGFKVKLGPTLPQRLPSWVTWAGRLRSSLPSLPICKQELTRPSSREEAGKTGKALRTLRSPLSRELPHFTSVLGLGKPEPPPPVHPSP